MSDEHPAQELGPWQPARARHGGRAARGAAWFDGDRRLRLSRTRVPQFTEVNAQLLPLTGFCLMPVAGLVTPGAFLRGLGRGVFLSTQYMRHTSTPLYTPKPDVVHELIGHAVSLANPDLALLNRRFGEVARTLSDDEMQPLIRAYWYSLEFGAMRAGGTFKVYGAGLLSSFGECGRFETAAELVPFDLDVMAATPFDPTDYQHTIFVAPSLEVTELERVHGGTLSTTITLDTLTITANGTFSDSADSSGGEDAAS